MSVASARRRARRGRALPALLAGAAVLCGAAGVAAAGEGPADDMGGWHLSVDGQTDFPIDVGVRAQAETPFRLRLATSAGWMPAPYVDAINAFLVGVNAYDQDTADLIQSALQSSLVWRAHAGYRPFAAHGLYLEAGYGLVTLGGGTTGSALVAGVTGNDLPPTKGRVDFQVLSTLHMADVEIGWEWTVVDHLHLRAAVGGAFTFAAATHIQNDAGLSGKAIESFEEGAASYLDSLYRSYVFTPVVSVGVGWAAF